MFQLLKKYQHFKKLFELKEMFKYRMSSTKRYNNRVKKSYGPVKLYLIFLCPENYSTERQYLVFIKHCFFKIIFIYF